MCSEPARCEVHAHLLTAFFLLRHDRHAKRPTASTSSLPDLSMLITGSMQPDSSSWKWNCEFLLQVQEHFCLPITSNTVQTNLLIAPRICLQDRVRSALQWPYHSSDCSQIRQGIDGHVFAVHAVRLNHFDERAYGTSFNNHLPDLQAKLQFLFNESILRTGDTFYQNSQDHLPCNITRKIHFGWLGAGKCNPLINPGPSSVPASTNPTGTILQDDPAYYQFFRFAVCCFHQRIQSRSRRNFETVCVGCQELYKLLDPSCPHNLSLQPMQVPDYFPDLRRPGQALSIDHSLWEPRNTKITCGQ